MLELDKIYCGDCLSLMPEIPDGTIDLILSDLPYGVTHNSWDKVIPPDVLWAEYKRIIKEHGAVLLTATQPFATDVIAAGRDIFRYDLIWQKTMPVGGLNANRMPLRSHELILVFYKHLPPYNPIFSEGKPYKGVRKAQAGGKDYGKVGQFVKNNAGTRHPTSIITVPQRDKDYCGHPTQKPVALFEYLIKTYTNPGDVVLDTCIGSGTTAVAAKRTGRHFIGIELSPDYCAIAEKRLSEIPLSLDAF